MTKRTSARLLLLSLGVVAALGASSSISMILIQTEVEVDGRVECAAVVGEERERKQQESRQGQDLRHIGLGKHESLPPPPLLLSRPALWTSCQSP
ncbi:hypothetical protein PR001_g33439 [Phytophthora rubi]|uniref:RxLR effector protein n=1 Tax=Phytophthora rubi TaxID=129364 RepID=A0A6A3G0Y1_9STRA|nr:hypothetical protein PR001_g33439 [Phytophthora rubi]